ncbi:hypothetical protein G6F23_014571 [Rhizopus arrhizus]|nr:hypothetical protein G6F23_014571 [Rhizopus arrhizus]
MAFVGHRQRLRLVAATQGKRHGEESGLPAEHDRTLAGGVDGEAVPARRHGHDQAVAAGLVQQHRFVASAALARAQVQRPAIGRQHRQRRAAIASAPVLHIRVSVRAGQHVGEPQQGL